MINEFSWLQTAKEGKKTSILRDALIAQSVYIENEYRLAWAQQTNIAARLSYMKLGSYFDSSIGTEIVHARAKLTKKKQLESHLILNTTTYTAVFQPFIFF